MENQVKYTYQDWWKGRVCLIYGLIVTGPKDPEPIRCDWCDFKEKDAQKIRDKQVEIFEDLRELRFKRWSKLFAEGYKSSELKTLYLKDEIEDIRRILFDKSLQGWHDTYTLKNHELYCSPNELPSIRRYIRDIIKKGMKRDYNNIHSPNFQFQPKTNGPIELHAQALWDLYKWLGAFKDETKKHAEKYRAESNNQVISQTQEFILAEFDSIDKESRWEYAFKSKDDYYNYAALLTHFFEYTVKPIPEKGIEIRRSSKTRFAKVLHSIHKELSEKPLKSDKGFLRLVRVISQFDKMTDIEIYKSITR